MENQLIFREISSEEGLLINGGGSGVVAGAVSSTIRYFEVHVSHNFANYATDLLNARQINKVIQRLTNLGYRTEHLPVQGNIKVYRKGS